MAHIACKHVLSFNNAKLCLCRKAMPDLKETIFLKVLEQLDGVLIEDYHYNVVTSSAKIDFYNGSKIISRSWHDKNYRKFRSLDLSAAIVEELTENDSEEFKGFYDELFPRLGRIPSIPQNFILNATNPDSPSHSAYDYFINIDDPNRFVFYSITSENPFLPKNYVDRLMARMNKLEIERYIKGRWVEIIGESIYYAYNQDKSATLNKYKINYKYPIYWTWDFNIAENKPMSCVFYQFINEKFFFFKEIVVQSYRTLDICEEANNLGLLDTPCKIIIQGDATGRHKDTRSIHSDYEIISKYLSNLENKYGAINFEMDVGLSNPPIKKRHSLVNGQMENAFGVTSLFLDKKECKMLDKGFRLTKLKKGGNYIEDDSVPWQHITTAAGYGICRTLGELDTGEYFRKIKMH